MYEHLASFPGGPPNEYHLRLYSEWAKYDWGIVVTGNVQTTGDHLTLGRDTVLPTSEATDERLLPFQKLAQSIHGLYHHPPPGPRCRKPNKTLAIMQLNHPGRQSSNFIGGRLPFHPPSAPSSIPLGYGTNSSLTSKLVNFILFQKPRTMSHGDIQQVVKGFIDGGVTAYRAGFDGVQLHVAHGYLLAQFLSPKANARKDAYCLDRALELLHTIVQGIRVSTSTDFVISVKLNAADYSPTDIAEDSLLTEGERRSLEHILALATWRLIDIVEISGGDYDQPDFMMSPKPSASNSPRQAFFARFSHRALLALENLRQEPACPGYLPLILLTGGLRTPGLLQKALALKHADLLGIGRGSVLCPDLPSVLAQRLQDLKTWGDIPFQPEPDLQLPGIFSYPIFRSIWEFVPKVKLIGAGLGMAWYVVAMRHIANTTVAGRDEKIRPEYDVGGLCSVFWMWFWSPVLRMAWQRRWTNYASLMCFLIVLITFVTFKLF
ncbi:hypothetical protein M413DRAFT_441104 [Hebeloma cylindrosporum]|uniref:NADH:flavin oxidoreductase/NADH oxidase N-terminal domain-containing protein n=1 Tax=Hebeloma cylindrosporum TaxID=76867 RepID=A0A0C2Y871_HEBCY|nr:hypothetical protein M413DRAFT_441104 [Hebeloma cylindrosporum h7]